MLAPLAEPLGFGVRFAYCRNEECWYWSADESVWQREDLVVIQDGPCKGQRLCDDDLARLAKLRYFKEDPFPSQHCGICEFGMQVPPSSFWNSLRFFTMEV